MNKSMHAEKDYKAGLEENFLRHIGHEYTELLCEELDAAKEEWKEIEIPDSLDRWFDDFHKLELKRREKNERRIRMTKFARKAAVFILLIIGVNYALVSNVEAYRLQWMNTIMSIQEKFTQIDFVENEPDYTAEIPKNWEGKYYPKYIPDGYKLSEEYTRNDIARIKYSNDLGFSIVFHQFGLQSSLQLDSETGKISNVNIGGKEGILIIKDDTVMISWAVGDIALQIEANQLDKKELIKIAESTDIKK